MNPREVDTEAGEIMELIPVEEGERGMPAEDTELGRFAAHLERNLANERTERTKLHGRVEGVASDVDGIAKDMKELKSMLATLMPGVKEQLRQNNNI
eukprot:7383812-Prymnesium_polylepis.1